MASHTPSNSRAHSLARDPSRAGSSGRGDASRARPTPAAPVRRILAALAETHRQRLDFEIARSSGSAASARPEPEHALSWRFGVPVR